MLFNRLKKDYRQWRKYRRIVDELSTLRQRELDDIGISRHSIRDVARNTVYRR